MPKIPASPEAPCALPGVSHWMLKILQRLLPISVSYYPFLLACTSAPRHTLGQDVKAAVNPRSCIHKQQPHYCGVLTSVPALHSKVECLQRCLTASSQ